MNNDILNKDIQHFISVSLKTNTADLILKGTPFSTVDDKLILEQIEAKKRCYKKLPTWFSTPQIYYPNKLNIEQSSSEATAKYKASLVDGKRLIDLTGGFGVDTFYFSQEVASTTYCELNANLAKIAQHNFAVLGAPNIEVVNVSGMDYLKDRNESFDWIYIDPSRRDATKNKVFLLSDCSPNIKTFQGLFLKYAKHVMIKTSPLLDIKATLSILKNVKELHVVALQNETKELLWILERDYIGTVEVKTINLLKEKHQYFNFIFSEEANANAAFSAPLTYLYEPNSAILKAGAFKSLSSQLKLAKLSKHSHLYTSKTVLSFPGRRFKIAEVIPFNKKALAKTGIKKANVTTRNFPLSVGDIRKKMKIKDGGDDYLFFTTDCHHQKIILLCHKL